MASELLSLAAALIMILLTIKNFWITAMAVGGILVLFYCTYTIYQRTTRRLKIRQKEIEDKDKLLFELVKEKEWLLKELDHRVKNNLQIVISLLNSQSAYLKDKTAKTAIKDIQHRMHPIFLIHQKSYNAGNLTGIYMPDYVDGLTAYFKDNIDFAKKIDFETSIEPVTMDISVALPIGLIINEGTTNSVKYAFPKDCEGQITISLELHNSNHFTLKISDNGVGLPAGFYNSPTTSLGMNIIQGLCGDIDASCSIINNRGTTITIEFSYDNQSHSHVFNEHPGR